MRAIFIFCRQLHRLRTPLFSLSLSVIQSRLFLMFSRFLFPFFSFLRKAPSHPSCEGYANMLRVLDEWVGNYSAQQTQHWDVGENFTRWAWKLSESETRLKFHWNLKKRNMFEILKFSVNMSVCISSVIRTKLYYLEVDSYRSLSSR